ncbi:hypothetical protein AKO1_008201 [Acrasis kona]|uniref:Uncharacterized protein n=1 Tax=Acrasis kona TaxID=1008807 RepID=A0AAW2YNK5_9EUKA
MSLKVSKETKKLMSLRDNLVGLLMRLQFSLDQTTTRLSASKRSFDYIRLTQYTKEHIELLEVFFNKVRTRSPEHFRAYIMRRDIDSQLKDVSLYSDLNIKPHFTSFCYDQTYESVKLIKKYIVKNVRPLYQHIQLPEEHRTTKEEIDPILQGDINDDIITQDILEQKSKFIKSHADIDTLLQVYKSAMIGAFDGSELLSCTLTDRIKTQVGILRKKFSAENDFVRGWIVDSITQVMAQSQQIDVLMNLDIDLILS